MALGATGLPREGAEKGRDAAGILGVPETPFPTMSAPGLGSSAPGIFQLIVIFWKLSKTYA